MTHVKIVCTVRPEKSDPNQTRITIGGNRIAYPGDVGTKTASLDLVKLMINSVISRKNARFACFDISNFYLGTPLGRPEYARVHVSDIPREFYEEYDLHDYEYNNYIIEIWNHLANRNNGLRTLIEKLKGHTPDISKFHPFICEVTGVRREVPQEQGIHWEVHWFSARQG